MTIEVMKMALEALCDFDYDKRQSAINALRAAIEQAQDLIPPDKLFVSGQLSSHVKLWQGLTDEEIEDAIDGWWRDDLKIQYAQLARSIEAKLKEKNT